MTGKHHPLRRFLPGLIGAALVVSVGVGVTLFISQFLDSEPPRTKKVVQNITLIKPPSPPPKIDEPPPEPEVEEEKVNVPEPEPLEDLPDLSNDDAPAGDSLGLDADGAGAGDGFGLIGRKGGRGLFAGGPFGGYATKLQKSVEQALYNDDRIRSRRYSLVLRMWVSRDGRIERVALNDTTGEPEVDDAIVDSLTGMIVSDAPPIEMVMPVKLRITARL